VRFNERTVSLDTRLDIRRQLEKHAIRTLKNRSASL